MNRIIKYALIGAVVGGAMGYVLHTYAQILPYTSPYITPTQPSTITPYQASPFNYNNSEFNPNNNSFSSNNNPFNPKNSEFNTTSPNRIYDNNGNAMGYITTTPQGVTNYFDFNGNRLGYKPAQ